MIAALILAYQRASLSVATIGITVLLLILSILVHPHFIFLGVIWFIWIVLSLILNLTPLRRWLITRSILKILAPHAPHFSATEQAVVNAGNVGWEAELFSGMPDLKHLLDLPWVRLSAQERAFLDGPVNELCRMIDPWWITSHQQIPENIWLHLKEQGYFGLGISSQYGGKGFSAFAQAQIIMKIASASTAVATIASVPNSLGPAELLSHYGASEQKNYFLPRLARGEEVPCFALTSPVAGSDASAIVDTGVVCYFEKNGQKTLGIRLNWNKRYITLAPVATILGLAFRLYDPDHLLGNIENLGITCAIVPVNTEGVTIGRHHNPLNCAFPNGPTQGKDVLVELNAIIGGISQAGKGWQMLMERLAAGRSLSLPSIAVGSTKMVAASCGVYARIRRQFNTYIGEFGGVQNILADIFQNAFTAEALRLFSVSQVDQGIHSATAAAISKYHTTELGRKVICGAMDVHGGKGICLGPNNYLAQRYIESPIAITVEGANVLTRSLIIFGQGAMRCHPVLLQEITAMQRNDLEMFDKAFFKHVGYLMSNQVRAWFLSLTSSKKNDRRLLRCSAVFALTTEIALITVGNALKRKEQLSLRLSDMLSDLYMISAILKYHRAENQNPVLTPLVEGSCCRLFQHFEQQCSEFISNLPCRWARLWLRLSIFSWGKKRGWVTDHLITEIAELLMTPGLARNILIADAYFGPPLTGLENILEQIISVEPILHKINQAERRHQIRGYNLEELINSACKSQVITAEEAKQLREVEELRMRIIQVDDFKQL